MSDREESNKEQRNEIPDLFAELPQITERFGDKHLVHDFKEILGEDYELPPTTETRYEKDTRELIQQANTSRLNRGKFGGVTLGNTRFAQLNACWGGIDVGIHLIAADSNLGKCQGRDTSILMYDGTIKMIQDVVTGDLLMGSDSKPRKVLSTTSGYGELHRVNQNKGNGSYVVNSHHILSVKKAYRNFKGHDYDSWYMSEPFNLSVEDYYKQSTTFKKMLMGYKVPVDFTYKEITLDPYFLGIWLGDGHSRTSSITTMDEEIKDKVYELALSSSMGVRVESKTNNKASSYHISGNTKNGKVRNIILDDLKKYNLINNKHIPQDYLTNSREIRLKVLAGILDTDGYYQGYNQVSNTYEITQKSERLANNIAFLARSLGFHATIKPVQKTCTNNGKTGTYHKIYVSGDLSEVPTLIPRKQFVASGGPRMSRRVLNHHITVEPIGPGEYFGFELDGDGLYLMGDFTVTHNSSLMRMMGWDIVKYNPNVDLRYYTLDDAEDYTIDCLVAQAARVPINAVHKPEQCLNWPEGFWKKEDYKRWVERGNSVYKELIEGNLLKNLSIVGTSTLGSASWLDISADIKQYKATMAPGRQLVIMIDNLHDIEIGDHPGDQNYNTEQVAGLVDRLAKQEELVVICSAELKKNQQRRPITDDICGSRKLKYNARTILLLYSEVGVQRPNPRLYYEREDRPGDQCSVLEIHFAKNKVSDFKGRIFAEQVTEQGWMKEVPPDRAKQYAMMIS